MSTTKWVLDPSHSEVQFKVKHLMISNVTGSLKIFSSTVETNGDDFTTAKINFSADVNSIDTNNEQRDAHLKGSDFFDAAAHPEIKFEGRKMEKVDAENYKLHGNFTIKGVTKPAVLDVEMGGIAKDAYGNTRAGFMVNGKINRQDYGITFGMVTEAGGVVVSDEVKLNSNIQYIKQA